MDLLFDNLLKVIDTLTPEDIIYRYWDPEIAASDMPDKNIFSEKEGDKMLKQLAMNLKLYFRCSSTDAAPNLFELLSSGKIA